MSGHSKWKNIAHKKGLSDAKRAKIFTKVGREIAVAVKEGGSDPSSNSKLKDIIAKARANNVPNDNIQRMIDKFSGAGKDTVSYETITYEGYGPSGIAVIVETMTDNRNRTAADLRHYFDKFGASMGATGCVSWQFEQKGVIVIDADIPQTEDEVMMNALDAGADDFSAEDGVYEITTEPSKLGEVRDALEAAGFSFIQAETEMVPSTYVSLEAEDDITRMEKLLEMLEDNDDVQNVWHNWENPTV